MINSKSIIQLLKENVQPSSDKLTLLRNPLINEDVWELTALGFSEQEIIIKGNRNIYFNQFHLLWLKNLAKLTVLQRCNDRHGISTIQATIYVLNELDKYLEQTGQNRLEDLSDSLLREFISQYPKDVQRWRQGKLAYATRLWNEEGWLSINYIPQRINKVIPKEIKVIPEESLHQFYNNLHRLPPMLERLLRLQLALGCRIGELLKMPRSCLKREGENWYLKRWIEKRKKWEFIQIHPLLAEVIRSQQKFLSTQFSENVEFDLLFCWLSAGSEHTGSSKVTRFEVSPAYAPKPLSFNNVLAWLRAFSKEINLQDQYGENFNLTTHMLRRTKAMFMAYCETNDEYIAAVLGHANLEMLPHYRQLSLEQLERKAKQNVYVNMNGDVISYKPKRTRYEQLHDLVIVHTSLGECHRPSMLGDCELRYACLNCKYHRVSVKDRPLLEQDRDSLLKDLAKSEVQGSTRKATEISLLLEVINNRLQGLEKIQQI